MTNKELYDLTKYLFESWERNADYDSYHTDCQYVLEGLVKPEEQQSCDKQEPVIWTKTWFEDGKVVTQHLTAKDIYKEPEQEPIGYLCENAVGHKYFTWKKPSSTYRPIALYTTPPKEQQSCDKREWIRLTDEEIETIAEQTLFPIKFARAIEAKLRENT